MEIYFDKDVKWCDKEKITLEYLYDFFCLFPNRTLYVLSGEHEKKLWGIVTAGDFKRYIRGEKEMINRQYSFFLENEKENAVLLLKNKRKIVSVPIVNNYSERILLGEMRKKDIVEENNKPAYELALMIYREALFLRYDCAIIVTGGNLEHERDELTAIYEQTNHKIRICNYLPIEDMKKLSGNDNIIFDLYHKETDSVIELYKYYRLNYFIFDENRRYTLDNIEKLFVLYNRIGVLQENRYFMEIGSRIIQGLRSIDFRWNNINECYEFCGSDEAIENCEVILTVFPISEKFYILHKEKYIPLISIFAISKSFSEHKNMITGDEDIAFNIIPKLVENGVSCIVIDNVQSPGSNWQEEFGIEKEQTTGVKVYNRKLAERSDNTWHCVNKDGYLHMADINKKDVHYQNGERYSGSFGKAEHTMFLFGPCLVFGGYVSDCDSMGYFLQQKLLDEFSYNVRNCGGASPGLNYVMREHRYYSGDVVVLFADNRKVYDLNGIPVYSVKDVYHEIDDLKYHIFDMLFHCDEVITEKLANRIFEICMEEKSLRRGMMPEDKIREEVVFGSKSKIRMNSELQQWLNKSLKYKRASLEAGAIVMNCNPFTCGHRYLIEKAALMVDVLYIFVVEEDKSFFAFEDRINMVRLGVEDLNNVVVIPSGRYILSAATLPGYFDKEANPYEFCDASEDLELFAAVIAPAFGITIRFAGEEPIDIFTQQYNLAMGRILPDYGVKFCEIERKKQGKEVISASRVRKCMKEKCFDEIKQLVLPQIYEYLEQHYFLSGKEEKL